jgi:hypothetical protein
MAAWLYPNSMTEDILHPVDAEDRPDDHQHAVEACSPAADALEYGDLPRVQALLDEACAAVERAQRDDRGQVQPESAGDCYG